MVEISLLQTNEERKVILDILMECGQDRQASVESYYKALLKQRILYIKEAGEILGFISYYEAYVSEGLEAYGTLSYISTLCILHSGRGKGYSRMLYQEAERDIWSHFPDRSIGLRISSENKAQLHILEELHYRCVRQIKNDRGDGIDTLYFLKRAGRAHASYEEVKDEIRVRHRVPGMAVGLLEQGTLMEEYYLGGIGTEELFEAAFIKGMYANKNAMKRFNTSCVDVEGEVSWGIGMGHYHKFLWQWGDNTNFKNFI